MQLQPLSWLVGTRPPVAQLCWLAAAFRFADLPFPFPPSLLLLPSSSCRPSLRRTPTPHTPYSYRLFGVLLREPASFHDAQEPGQLTSRLTSDCYAITRCIATNVNIALRNLVQVIGAHQLRPKSAVHPPMLPCFSRCHV